MSLVPYVIEQTSRGERSYDIYSRLLKEFLKTNNLENYIFIYNSRNDIQHVLSQATIGILASTQEGFPVALLFLRKEKNSSGIKYGGIELHLSIKKGTNKLIPVMI